MSDRAPAEQYSSKEDIDTELHSVLTTEIEKGCAETNLDRGFGSRNDLQVVEEFEPKAGCSTDSDVKAESGEKPFVQRDTENKPGESSQSKANKSIREVTLEARNAAIEARKAAESCQVIKDATLEAAEFGLKRISKGNKKADATADRRERDNYRDLVNTFEASVRSANIKARAVEEAAISAATAANTADEAANSLSEAESKASSDVQEKINSTVQATIDANDKTILAVKAEFRALKSMMKCYAALDMSEFSGVRMNLGSRSASGSGKFCSSGDDRCKWNAVMSVLFVGGCVLFAISANMVQSKWFHTLLGWGGLLIGIAVAYVIYLLVMHFSQKRKNLKREKDREIIREIHNRLGELEAYFIRNRIEYEDLQEN